MGGIISWFIKQPPPPPQPAPTTAEVSQSGATDADTLRKRRRGKSPTILTSVTGVEGEATLGKKTLLGA